MRISLETPAAISGVMPGASFASVSPVAPSESSQTRKPPTVSGPERMASGLPYSSVPSQLRLANSIGVDSNAVSTSA